MVPQSLCGSVSKEHLAIPMGEAELRQERTLLLDRSDMISPKFQFLGPIPSTKINFFLQPSSLQFQDECHAMIVECMTAEFQV